MKNLVSRFVSDESGATAIEYGLIAAGISVAIIAVVQGVGGKLKTTFTAVRNCPHAQALNHQSGCRPRSNSGESAGAFLCLARGEGKKPQSFPAKLRDLPYVMFKAGNHTRE